MVRKVNTFFSFIEQKDTVSRWANAIFCKSAKGGMHKRRISVARDAETRYIATVISDIGPGMKCHRHSVRNPVAL